MILNASIVLIVLFHTCSSCKYTHIDYVDLQWPENSYSLDWVQSENMTRYYNYRSSRTLTIMSSNGQSFFWSNDSFVDVPEIPGSMTLFSINSISYQLIWEKIKLTEYSYILKTPFERGGLIPTADRHFVRYRDIEFYVFCSDTNWPLACKYAYVEVVDQAVPKWSYSFNWIDTHYFTAYYNLTSNEPFQVMMLLNGLDRPNLYYIFGLNESLIIYEESLARRAVVFYRPEELVQSLFYDLDKSWINKTNYALRFGRTGTAIIPNANQCISMTELNKTTNFHCWNDEEPECRSSNSEGTPYPGSHTIAVTDTPKYENVTFDDADPGLKNLSSIPITTHNVHSILNDSLPYSQKGKMLNPDDVTCLSLIVRNSATLKELDHPVATLLLENVDYMQGAALETFAESNQPGKGDGTTQRIVNAVHNMVQNLQDSNFDYMTGQQLGLRAINKDNHDDDLSIGHDGEKFDSKPGDNSVASITIPKAAMDGGGRVYVAYWATNKLFIPKRITYTRSTEQSGQYITSLTHAEKCSQTLTPTGKDPVLTGTILDKSSTNSAKLAQSSKQLQAVITYDKKKALHPLHGEYKVTWWDKYFSQWARDEQCEMVSNTGRIVAHCYHLTDFTLVEDGMQNDPLVCSVPLQAIAYTLNVLSIVSLIVFMTIRATRYLRRVNQEQPSTPLQKILLNKFLQRKNANEPVVEDLMYTLFLFLFYLFFTCFKDQRVTHNGCEAMGGIAYFLFLCIPFQVFVFAIGDVALRLSYKKVGLYASPATALGVSIGLSFVITVGLGAGSDFFKRNDQFCWIRPTYVVPGIVLPLVFIFTTGIMSTACVAWAFFESRNQNNDLNSWQTRKERLLRITRIVQMQLHLGLPWIFQFASLAFPYVTAWHYLFAFTNDSQGIIHLLIFFLFDKLEAVRKDYEENRSEVDAKQVMEQEKNDRDLLENYYHKEETSVKRRTQIEFTSYAETIEEPYYSRPAATSTPVAHQKSVKTTLYDEPPGETYPEILKRISLEDRQRNSRMIELKSMDFSVEDELWDEEDLEQDTADPEQGNDSTTESSKSDGLGADEAFVNDTVDCTNSTNSGGDGDDAGTAEQNVNEPEQDGNSTTESLDSSEVELSEDNPIDYTNSTDSDGSEDENGADDAANDDGTAPEYEVIQTNPSEPEVHSPLKLKAHENAEEELNWLAGRVTDRAKDDGYDVPSKSEPTSTRNLKTESKMEDDGDLTELPQKTIIDRLPSYKPPSPPPLSTMPAITYLPLITTEPPSDDENPNVKRRWKDHLQRQDSIDESDVE